MITRKSFNIETLNSLKLIGKKEFIKPGVTHLITKHRTLIVDFPLLSRWVENEEVSNYVSTARISPWMTKVKPQNVNLILIITRL